MLINLTIEVDPCYSTVVGRQDMPLLTLSVTFFVIMTKRRNMCLTFFICNMFEVTIEYFYEKYT